MKVFNPIRFYQLFKPITVTLIIGLCSACATNQTSQSSFQQDDWKFKVVREYDKLPREHPNRVENILSLNQEMRTLVDEKFTTGHKNQRINAIAQWLVSKNGHNLTYDVDTDLTPTQAFEQRQGNCLTFTMLLVSLAEQMEINLDFNEVDIPNSWGSKQNTTFILYRHVNAYRESGTLKQVFDLAMENYEFGYPQRVINKDQAIAKYHSNRAIQLMRKSQLDLADNLFKLALSLDPKSADIWANYGTLLKRKDDFQKAEDSFLHALSLDSSHAVAASNLERLYKENGVDNLAEKYRLVALRARNTNPYYHFQAAESYLQQTEYKSGLKHIKKALRLHNKDHRFYNLKGKLYTHLERLDLAEKSFYKANQLAETLDDKLRYANEIYDLNDRFSLNSNSQQHNWIVVPRDYLRSMTE